MKKLSKILLAVVLTLASICLFACNSGIDVEKEVTLNLSAEKSVVAPGETVQFDTEIVTTLEGVTASYQIVKGSDIASIDENGLLTVSSEAKNNAIISVVAKHQSVKSNEVELTVKIAPTSISISATRTEIKQGETALLSHVIEPAGASNDGFEYVVTEGSELCAVSNAGILFINEDATVGATVKIKAIVGDIESAELSFTVLSSKSDKVYLTLSSNKRIVAPGETAQFSTAIDTELEDVTVTYEIKEGSSIASIDEDGLLTVSSEAKNGDVISVVSKYQEVVSNEVELTVKINPTSISISASKTEIEQGEQIFITYSILPAGASKDGLEYSVTEGEELCSISDLGVLSVEEEAPIGSIIKVKAIIGSVESNELSFTVKTNLLFNLSDDDVELDVNGGSFPVLEAEIYDIHFNEVTDKVVEYQVIEGAEYLSIAQENNVCSFTALGHGTAVVEATIQGTPLKATATVKVIVPPDSIKIPDVFTSGKRVAYAYNFSKVDDLPFAVSAVGEKACQDLTVSFLNEQGVEDGSLAKYENGKISFLKTGKVTVKVTSASGSRQETSASYTFNVNDGINVYDFKQLKTTLEAKTYNGQIVNIVVLEKPVGNYSYEYGYDLVPEFALKAQADQTYQKIIGNSGNIFVLSKHLHLNGNYHTIDASQVRPFTKAEKNSMGGSNAVDLINPLISIHREDSGAQDTIRNVVKIYDLNVKGNCPYDFATIYNADGSTSINNERMIDNNKKAFGGHFIGIRVGIADNVETNKAHYDLDMKNVTASGFYVGLRLSNTVGASKVENVHVYDCFSNGIEVNSCILTFKDMTFGMCGATGIELCPGYSNNAGENHNENQKITFTGKIENSNLSDGKSSYMQRYQVAGYTVQQILLSVIQPYADKPEVLSNILNEEQKFAFIAFVFNDLGKTGADAFNATQVSYADIDGAGIVEATDLTGIDTTHKYIRLNVNISGLGNAGTVLLYNHNYGKTVA